MGQRHAILEVRPQDQPAAMRFRAAILAERGQRRLTGGARHLIWVPYRAGSTAAGARSLSSGCRARYSVDRPIFRCRAMAVTDSPRNCRARAMARNVVIDSGGTAAAPALRLGGAQPVKGALADQVAFHLRGHRGHHEQHLVCDGGAVRAVDPGADAGQDVQVDAARVQLVFQQHEQFLHGPGDPVRLVDHQCVAGLQLAQGLTQPGPVAAGAGGLGDDLPAVRLGERVELGLVFLGPGGDPGVADADAVVVGGHGGHGADRPAYRPATGGATRNFGTSFRDELSWAAAGGGRSPGNDRFRDGRDRRLSGEARSRLVWRLRCLSAVDANRTGCLIRFGPCIV